LLLSIPLHIGVTEAVEGEDERMKSAIGIRGYNRNQDQRSTIFWDGNYLT
jgi:hypothetical protein